MGLSGFFRGLLARKAMQVAMLPIVPTWLGASFLEPSWDWLVGSAYTRNSAVIACLQVLAFAFPEPPLKWYKDGKEQPSHPGRLLYRRPNPTMGEAELAVYKIVYAALGGNAYIHKVRNQTGRVTRLVPYHAGQLFAVPGQTEWIAGYDYRHADGTTRLPPEDVLHFKWPLPDTTQPWQALPPLVAAAREVGTDNEATRYLMALLQNDAVPRMVLEVPEGSVLDPDEHKRIQAMWGARYGGDNRGKTAILQGGIKATRLSLNLQELAFEALHKMPETRIASAFRVPPIVAGLAAGLDRATYSNFAEAVSHFTAQTLTPLWRIMASEVQNDPDLNPGGECEVRYDLSMVQALQEDENARWERFGKALDRGGITINQFLVGVGREPIPGGDVFLWKSNVFPVTFAGGTPMALYAPTAPTPEEPDEQENKAARITARTRKAKRRMPSAADLLADPEVLERASELAAEALE